MITPLATLAAAILSASSPNRTVELSDPRLAVLGSNITSVSTDGDTAFVVTGNTVMKAVYGSDLKVVDSLPRRGTTWSISKYVGLPDGLGILAIGNGPSDTAFWLIDWKGTSKTALTPGEAGTRWAGQSGLQFAKIASNASAYGFSGESNLTGVKNSTSTAVFAGDKGVFMLNAVRNASGTASFRVISQKSDSGRFLWSNVSLATHASRNTTMATLDLAASRMSGADNLLFHSDYATEDLGWLKLADSTSSPWGFNLASGTGACWLQVASTGRSARHNCLVDGVLHQDSLLVPTLTTRSSLYLHSAATTLSRNGIGVLAGDSLLAFYDWDGYRAPVPAGTIALRTPTSGVEFGDTTFWHASKNQLRAFRWGTVEDPDRPANSKGSLDGSTLSASWTAAPGAASYAVQVNIGGENTTAFVSTNSASLRLPSPMSSSSLTAEGIWWRVADAKGLDASAPVAETNALNFTAWQKANTNPAGIVGTAPGAGFEAKASHRGISIAWISRNGGSVEIFDGSGRALGRIEAGPGATEFVTSRKGLFVVRGADQVVKLTRF